MCKKPILSGNDYGLFFIRATPKQPEGETSAACGVARVNSRFVRLSVGNHRNH